MKRIAIALLVLMLVLSLVACGGKETPAADPGTSPSGEDTPPTTQAPEGEGEAMASLIDWMIGGTFSYDFTMTSESAEGTITATGSMAMDGGKVSITQEMDYDGQTMTSRIILKDDKTYVIDDASKMIIAMSGVNEEALSGMVTDYSGITKTGEGEGEFDGRTLPYEEYTQDGYVVRYYMDGGQVCGFETEAEGYKTIMVITNPTNNVPAGAFDLPEGYTEIAM
jgi:predicted small lipoprotein YifL